MSVRLPTRPRPVQTERQSSTIGLEHAGTAMTTDEFDALTTDDVDPVFRYELVRGVLIVSPIPSSQETNLNGQLEYWLRFYREQHPEGRALDGTLYERYVLGTENRRRADRLIWAGLGRPPREDRDPPTIIVEFVSAARRDRLRDYEIKRDEYLTLAIREYWVIDRFRRAMTVFLKRDGGVEQRTITENEVYRTPCLPGFELQPGRLFAADVGWAETEPQEAEPNAPDPQAPPQTEAP